MTVALVHDYLVQYGGAERVVEALLEAFPGAPLYTSICHRDALHGAMGGAEIRTSFLQRLPLRPRVSQRYLLPLYPLAFRRLDLTGFDVVVSSASSFAKVLRLPPAACHVCYCHAPTRFLWDFDAYARRERLRWPVRMAIAPLIGRLRRLDLEAARRVTRFVANSRETARRIGEVYGRTAEVIHPPVDLTDLAPSREADGGFFLVASRLVPSKHVDLAILAFNALGLPLLVVGEGRHRPFLEGIAGPTVRFAGWVRRGKLVEYYSRCRALVVPGEEDFGIATVEAQACGRPVIAYGAGGALETVNEGETGVLFDTQSPEGLRDAVDRFSRTRFDPLLIQAHALQFDKEAFKGKIRQFVESATAAHAGAGRLG